MSKLLQDYQQLKSQRLLEVQAMIDKLEAWVNDKSVKIKVNGSANASVIEVPPSTQGLLRRDFKMSEQIGEPGQAEKLIYISSNHQIKSGLKRKNTEGEIVDAAIRVILPHTSLRSYIETMPDLGLPQLQKILAIHYCEKTALKLYQRLTTMCQKPKQSVQLFLLRNMDARNKVVFANKEANTNFSYGSQLIHFSETARNTYW